MQVTSSEYDTDTGVLRLRLADGAEYKIDNPGHARLIRDKISPGGMVTGEQRWWLEKFRIDAKTGNRQKLRARLGDMRRELAGTRGHKGK